MSLALIRFSALFCLQHVTCSATAQRDAGLKGLVNVTVLVIGASESRQTKRVNVSSTIFNVLCES
jgi:hypothetical protein